VRCNSQVPLAGASLLSAGQKLVVDGGMTKKMINA
jgi:hypothetical protein